MFIARALTSELLFESFSQDPEYKRELGRYLLMILQTIAKNRVDRGKGTDASHYFPRSKSLILTATLPEKVVSLLEYPERILYLTKNAYRDILKPFFESDAFVNKGKAWFTIRGFKYDPKRRDLSALSQEEINEKLPDALKRIS